MCSRRILPQKGTDDQSGMRGALHARVSRERVCDIASRSCNEHAFSSQVVTTFRLLFLRSQGKPYTYDAANRMTSVNGQAYTWDANGNLLSDGSKTYLYNQANRLITITATGLSLRLRSRLALSVAEGSGHLR